MAKHNEIGVLGERIAVQFLKNKGLSIQKTNYRKKYGEIDIVARENQITRFVEVKSVSYETDREVVIQPQENMHPGKIKRLSRVIESYVISHETDVWVFDLILVYINTRKRSAKIKWLKDIYSYKIMSFSFLYNE